MNALPSKTGAGSRAHLYRATHAYTAFHAGEGADVSKPSLLCNGLSAII